MNERQKELYSFLLSKSGQGYIAKEEIVSALTELYPRQTEITNDHNSAAFAMIRKDVRAINSSDAYKIIVSSKSGYKVANESEAIDYIERRFKRDLSSMKISWNLKRKVGINGQLTMKGTDVYREIRTFMEG